MPVSFLPSSLLYKVFIALTNDLYDSALSKIVNDVSKGKSVPEEIAKVEKTIDDVKQ